VGDGAGRLFVFSSPSGGGKTTVIRELLRRNPDLRYAVSATTRSPRPGERPGVDYVFLTPSEFDAAVREGLFYEWADVYGQRYGTLRRQVDPHVAAGRSVLLDLDPQGALAMRRKRRDTILVFLLPPSLGELERRLTLRKSETPEVIQRRLDAAVVEMQNAEQYDVQMVNDVLPDVVDELDRWIRSFQNQKEHA